MDDLSKVFKSVLEVDRAAVVICDLEHKIIYMNPVAVVRYDKWGGRDLLGKSLLDCHNEKSRTMIRKVVEWFGVSKDNNLCIPHTTLKRIKTCIWLRSAMIPVI